MYFNFQYILVNDYKPQFKILDNISMLNIISESLLIFIFNPALKLFADFYIQSKNISKS